MRVNPMPKPLKSGRYPEINPGKGAIKDIDDSEEGSAAEKEIFRGGRRETLTHPRQEL